MTDDPIAAALADNDLTDGDTVFRFRDVYGPAAKRHVLASIDYDRVTALCGREGDMGGSSGADEVVGWALQQGGNPTQWLDLHSGCVKALKRRAKSA